MIDSTTIGLLNAERERQTAKWGVQQHNQLYWLAILMEEVGEYATGVMDRDAVNVQDELVQIAAVAISAIECLNRNGLQGAVEVMTWYCQTCNARLLKELPGSDAHCENCVKAGLNH